MPDTLRRVAYAENHFVVVGVRFVLMSADGLDWTAYRLERGQNLSDVVYANGPFVAVGFGGTILTSN